MKKTILIGSLICANFLYAGGSKNILEPASEAMAISNATTAASPLLYLSDIYVGLGVGKFTLDNDKTKEDFSANYGALITGFDVNKYIGMEGRYTVSFGDMSYGHGNNEQTINGDISSKYRNIAIYAKLKYDIGNFKPYALLGFGESTVTDLGGFDRKEAGFQYGVGVGYNINNNWEVFVDYVKAYDDKGFDAVAQGSDIGISLISFGVNYHFYNR